MHQLIELYKNPESLHHAYFVVSGKVEEVVGELKHFLEKTMGIKISGNPDVWHGQFKTFSISDARALSDSQERKDFSGSKKVFIIETEIITEEAQNALLKVFEEPTAGTHFFIISPQDILLPTLRSRMHVLNLSTSQVDKFQGETLNSRRYLEILKMKMKDRLVKVKEITDAISDEEKTKQDAISLLNHIEDELYHTLHHTENITRLNLVNALKVCENARVSLYDRGAPIKIILENVMLTI